MFRNTVPGIIFLGVVSSLIAAYIWDNRSRAGNGREVEQPTKTATSVPLVAEQAPLANTNSLMSQASAESDVRKALPIYSRLADLGYTPAMEELGDIYSASWPDGPKKNDILSRNWYRKAADLGDAHAMLELGYIYVPDYAEAEVWYRKAAESGNPHAMWELGDIYERGLGVPKDDVGSRSWYRKAADAGDAKAMVKVASWYERGDGVAKDVATAIAWYQKALDKASRDDDEVPNSASHAWDNRIYLPEFLPTPRDEAHWGLARLGAASP